jgi:hypothetical protein
VNLLISTYRILMFVFPLRNVVLRVLLLTAFDGRYGSEKAGIRVNFLYNLQECDMLVDIREYHVFPCIY